MGKKKNIRTQVQINNNDFNLRTEKIKFEKTLLLSLSITFFICIIIFYDFVTLDKLFFYKDIGSDSLNQTYPTLYHNNRFLRNLKLPFWSFNIGLGQNSFAYLLSDPFDLFILLFPINIVKYLVIYKVIIQFLLIALVFHSYLKLLKLENFSIIVGTLLYTFSGFLIVSSGWFIFTIEALSFALFLLSVELYIQRNFFWIIPIPFILISIFRPFVLAPLSIFGLSYFILRLYMEDDLSFKSFFKKTSFYLCFCLIGILIAFPFFLENLKIMIESPRGSGANSLSQSLMSIDIWQMVDKRQLLTAIFRMFSTEILGSGSDYKGWSNILEAPNYYCSILAVISLPHLFSIKDFKLKKALLIFLLIWFLPTVFPFFRYAISFFTGDYYRTYSLYFSFVIIFVSLFSLNEIIKNHKFSSRISIITIFALSVILFYPFFENEIKTSYVVFLVLVFASTYYFIFFSKKLNQSANEVYILVLLVIELLIFSYISINNRQILSVDEDHSKIGYNDYSIEAIDFLKKHDNDFYRIDKRYQSSVAQHLSLNDALVQDFYGTSSYSSFNQKYYIQYLKLYGIIDSSDESQTRWARGLVGRPVLEILNNVKYVLTKENNIDFNTSLLYDSIAQFNDIKVLKHKFQLPLGYSYNKYVLLSDFKKCSNLQKEIVSLQAAVVNDADFNLVKDLDKFNLSDTISPSEYTVDFIKNSIEKLNEESTLIKYFDSDKIVAKFKTTRPRIVYFSIPFDKNWNIAGVDKKNIAILSSGMFGIKIPAGNSEIKLFYKSKEFYTGLAVSLITFLFLLILFLIIFRKNLKAKFVNTNR